MSNDIEFIEGLFAKAPHEKAPDFVKCKLSIKLADLGNWLRGKDDEWINIDVKESKGGKWYCSVDTFKPELQQAPQSAPSTPHAPADDFSDDVPFMNPYQFTYLCV